MTLGIFVWTLRDAVGVVLLVLAFAAMVSGFIYYGSVLLLDWIETKWRRFKRRFK